MSAPPRAPSPAFGIRGRLGLREALWLNLRATRARTYVRVVGSLREISWLVSDAVLPNLGMVAFVLLYRAIGAPASFEALAVVGGLLSTYWLNVLWGMGAQLYWEKQQGQLQLYFAAPCSRMSILTGMAVGGVLMTTLRSVVGIAIALWVLKVPIPPFDPWAMLMVFALTMAALYALGMTLSSVFLLWGREAWHISNALTEPVYFASGLYFPLRTLGGIGAALATVLPLGLGVDAMRQVLLGPAAHPLLSLRAEIAILAVVTVAFFALARAMLGYLEALSKREGRLTQRWQ